MQFANAAKIDEDSRRKIRAYAAEMKHFEETLDAMLKQRKAKSSKITLIQIQHTHRSYCIYTYVYDTVYIISIACMEVFSSPSELWRTSLGTCGPGPTDQHALQGPG